MLLGALLSLWNEEYMRKMEKMKWKHIQKEVKTMEGKKPGSDHAVRNAVARVATAGARGIATTSYHNSGRRYGEDGGKYLITPQQENDVVKFVKNWRNKKFCTCKYIKRELKLGATPRTIARALNRNGYRWCQVSKKSPLTAKQMQQRKLWVNRYLNKSPTWWTQNMHLIFDGVTLTKAPKNLDLRQKHAAQSIRHMWMKETEKMDPTLHTHNRYGVQLGTKVPLWGGFTGDGTFSLRLWTAKPKMKKEDWIQNIPQLKRAAATCGTSEVLIGLQTPSMAQPCVWQSYMQATWLCHSCFSNSKVVEPRGSRCGMTTRSSSRHKRNTRKQG